MFQKSTFFMRIIVILLGVVVVVPCIISLPSILEISKSTIISIKAQTESLSPYSHLLLPGAAYIALIPFIVALCQTLKLLGYIDNKETFSEKSIEALKIIKNCAMAIFGLYIIGIMPMTYYLIQNDYPLSTILFGAAFSLIPIAIAVFASMLMKLLQEAIDIKSENDLTI